MSQPDPALPPPLASESWNAHGAHSDPALAPRRHVSLLEALAFIVPIPILQWLLPNGEFGPWGPVVLMVGPFLFATLLLRRNGERWVDLGLRRPVSWPRTIGWVIGTWLGLGLLLGLLMPVLLRLLDTPPADISSFARVRGDLYLYLVTLLPVSWGSAAFGEELGRAFVMSRLQRIFGGSAFATLMVVLIQAALFGFAHSYQGMTGIIQTGLFGLAMGIVYVASKRNLWVLVLTHGLVDTIAITALYLGAAVPGV